jgi:hypothetical protein
MYKEGQRQPHCVAGHAKDDLELPKGGHRQVGTCKKKIPAMLK